jgi:tetratricopeptide (TPR) repeat protein
VKFLLVLFVLVAFIFFKRGYLYVALASFFLNKDGEKNSRRSWTFYEKGWRAGIAPNYTVMLGNLFVQRGDAKIAKEIFDDVIQKGEAKKRKFAEVLNSAKVSRSMSLWVLGDKNEAVSELQALKDEGYMDANLAVNLGSYLLDQNRLDEMETFIDESCKILKETGGMIDNRGHYLYLRGTLLEAEALYTSLIKENEPKFPEAYMHAGLVKMALGKYSQATTLFEKSLTFPFYQTATITKEEVEKLLQEVEGLENVDVDEKDSEQEMLEASLYEDDMFDDETPYTEIDEDEDELEPNIELDDIDYADEEESEVIIDPDEFSPLESQLYDEQDDESKN